MIIVGDASESTITNNTSNELEIFPYARISRNIENLPITRSVVHEGMSAVIDNKLKELKYSDLKSSESESFESKGGWFGFSDRYWFSAFILNDGEKNKITLKNIDDKIPFINWFILPYVLCYPWWYLGLIVPLIYNKPKFYRYICVIELKRCCLY